MAAKSPGYIRKWLQNTESAEVPNQCAQALIGTVGVSAIKHILTGHTGLTAASHLLLVRKILFVVKFA